MVKDTRKAFRSEKLVLDDGTVIRFNGKFDPVKGQLKVYDIYGDINKMDLIQDAFVNFTAGLGLAEGVK